MRFLIVVLVVACLMAGDLLAAERVPFRRSDVFELEWVSDPQISPDGKRTVYVRNGMDIMTDAKVGKLWLVGNDGG